MRTTLIMVGILCAFVLEGRLLSTILLILIALAVLCFLVLSLAKAWRFSHYPLHSRLELYPVPKEGKGRAEYGGSYFEEPLWWSKPRSINTANETKDILMEMLFIKKLFRYQRSFWWASYAFHLGIYCMVAWSVLLILATLWPLEWLVLLASIVAIIGFALTTCGALALLIRRIVNPTLRHYTTPEEFFNLSLILFVLISGIICWTAIASPYEVAALLFGQSGTDPAILSPLVVVHLIALAIMIVYIPASKMSHYVGKFFAFHKVLWDNDPNHKGSKVNEQLVRQSKGAKPATWAAPHILSNDQTAKR